MYIVYKNYVDVVVASTCNYCMWILFVGRVDYHVHGSNKLQ